MDTSHQSHSHSMKDAIVKAFEESIRVKQAFLRDNLEVLMQVIDLIVAAFKNGHKLLLFGNGGSAADAQHIAAEFTNRYLLERPPLPALALTTDSSALTAIANDYNYEQIFAKQILALGKPGDIAVAISTSGNSPNVLKALDACKSIGICTIGLTGGSGGKMIGKVDCMLRVAEGKNSPRIQETHILVGHVICDIVDQKLFPGV
jgi:D-sedoheptulose 7-phosphate isomerase